ncbi:2'-5' RNA ligase family protein [Chitinophaga defluvii]|uniref:2'-5' RNA ligase family protein n=1 Tax=Chitinophaga defluvii TaxID=3163343 RepID=A0ABV2TDM3_9BACT
MNFEHQSPRGRRAVDNRHLSDNGGNNQRRNYRDPDADHSYNRGTGDNYNRNYNRGGSHDRPHHRDNQRKDNRNRPRGGPSRKPRPFTRKPENKLYFIALLPNAETGMEIIRLKQEFAEQFGAVHALKVMPHITMQVPFTADPAMERSFCEGLTEFAATQTPFEIVLNGFGSFPHQDKKVLFIQVEKTAGMLEMHRQLVSYLRKEFGFSTMLARNSFTPHITVAFKDLTQEQFDKAWAIYEKKPYNATFRVNNLYLMRHNDNSWEVLHKCRLGLPVKK